ncbi:MAG: heat-inducible transcriptional repressor HrcA [Melioribacteraceae bacterium]|jgi:heat-inducible transcriptional repressor|nr:heat-inducible transcriptional repressor HrcA [Melioribacteraceae bacterium]
METYELTDREKAILRYVIQQFILTANPVGSRNIAKRYDIGLSPASIRNIMSDLEESGFLNHPHTSAGRIPTDKGYRFYVDSLMDPPILDLSQKDLITQGLESIKGETEDLLKLTSVILSNLTNQLALVTYPKFDQAILQKIQIVQLSSKRILVVVSVESGLVKTITLELTIDIKQENLQLTERFLNERLSGLKFSEIRNTLNERIKDYKHEESKPLIRVFIDSVDQIFADNKIEDKSFLAGTKNILNHPEFEDHEHLQGVIELIEDKDIIIHLMDSKRTGSVDNVSITIGSENIHTKFSDYSFVTKEYKVGEATGTLGIIGPKRMEYSKIVAAVVYIGELLSEELKK